MGAQYTKDNVLVYSARKILSVLMSRDEMSYEDARETIYGIPYPEWKAKHQAEANPDQLAAYEATKPNN